MTTRDSLTLSGGLGIGISRNIYVGNINLISLGDVTRTTRVANNNLDENGNELSGPSGPSECKSKNLNKDITVLC